MSRSGAFAVLHKMRGGRDLTRRQCVDGTSSREGDFARATRLSARPRGRPASVLSFTWWRETSPAATELPFFWCVGPTSAEDVPNRIPPPFSPRLASAARGHQGGFRVTGEAGPSKPDRARDVGVGPADDRIPAALRQSLHSAPPAGQPR